MNTRKTLLAALASGALLLPVVLAAPASATPGGCSDENAGAAGRTLPRCGSDILHAGAQVNLNTGGTCGDDTLLLIGVRANEGGTRKTLVEARNTDKNAQKELATAKATYDTALANQKAVADAQTAYTSGLNAYLAANPTKTAADYNLTPAGNVLHQKLTDALAAQTAGPNLVNSRETYTDAQNKAHDARVALNKAEAADHVLVVRIGALVDRINHECGTPTPVPPTTTTPVPPPTTDVPPPPAATAPPSGSNNTQVIVQGPAPQVVQGPSQIGQAPQGFVSAGGGADAAIVSAQS